MMPLLSAMKARAKLRKDKERAKVRRAKARIKKQQSPTYLKAKADKLFHALIRSRGYCESGRVSHKGPLSCAHGFSRRYLAVRWDTRNAWCFCAGCHLYYTHRPIEWDNWMLATSIHYQELRGLALYGQCDINEVIERLESVPSE